MALVFKWLLRIVLKRGFWARNTCGLWDRPWAQPEIKRLLIWFLDVRMHCDEIFTCCWMRFNPRNQRICPLLLAPRGSTLLTDRGLFNNHFLFITNKVTTLHLISSQATQDQFSLVQWKYKRNNCISCARFWTARKSLYVNKSNDTHAHQSHHSVLIWTHKFNCMIYLYGYVESFTCFHNNGIRIIQDTITFWSLYTI